MEQQPTTKACVREALSTEDDNGQGDITTEHKDSWQTLKNHYMESDDASMLPKVIRVARENVALSVDGVDRPKVLHALAWSLYQSYKQVEPDWDHLQESMSFERKAIEALPMDSSSRQIYSYWLGLQLGDSFYHTSDVSDLDEAFGLVQSSLHKLPDNTPMRATHLANLGVILKEKYNHLGAEQDFTDACETLEQALALASDIHHEPSLWYETLADLYDERHSKLWILEDLEKVVQLRRESLSATRSDQEAAVRPTRQFNLAVSLAVLYDQKGLFENLQESIKVAREALGATSQDDPAWLIRIRFLSLRLHSSYLETGRQPELEESINFGKAWLEIAGSEHPDRPTQLNNISVNLNYLYDRTGKVDDLDGSIRYGRQSLEDTPKDEPGLRLVLGNLGTALSSRAQATGSLVDLEEAIFYARSALDATSENHPTRHMQLHNLASALQKKYIRNLDNVDILNEAIMLSRKALASVPEDHPDIETYQNRLASGLNYRHNILRSARDLEESMQLSRKVAYAMDNKHTGRTFARSTFAALLQKRFKTGGSLDDINEAIEVSQKALDLTPEESPSRTEHWITLGNLFISKYARTRLDIDVEQAIDYYRSAVYHPAGQSLRRIIAATTVVGICTTYEQSYEIGRAALDLVPGLAAVRSLGTADRQYLLSHAAGLAANTAGAALRIGKQPSEALLILEQGRGLLASSLGEIRTDIKNLQHSFPALAEEFVRLRDELESSTENPQSSQANTGNRRRDAAKNFDELLLQIRQKPEFEDFLGPLSIDQIYSAATYGPVVVVNSSFMGCEAIIVQEQHLASMVFTNMQEYFAIEETAESDYGSVETLEKLWNSIMSKILEELGFTETPSDEQEWPHVWWIPTGSLSRFPLHASGLHRERSGKTVMDRVISSYSPSLTALVRGRRHREIEVSPAQALLLAMEDTQSQARLPKAAEEVGLVGKICISMGIQPVMPGSDKQDALFYLRDCKIFHFAGHAYTDSTDPSKSHLCFSDTSDPLTVTNILELNHYEKSPFLAYLSACSTGRVQDDRFIDESIHLISACQLAGFRHVIGTLWRVQDEHCVDVARITYEDIREGGMTDDSVCRGLHRATRMMRDVWLDSVEGNGGSTPRILQGGERDARDIVSCEEDSLAPAYWVPYVHFGI